MTGFAKVCLEKDKLVGCELNIMAEMYYLKSMFEVQAMTRDEYIEQMGNLAHALDSLQVLYDYRSEEE